MPRALVVPRVLKRSTARSASAGSRQAALRSTWLSIMPPWVGSGWTQMMVATGAQRVGSASSPTSRRASLVVRTMGRRRAGRTDAANSATAQMARVRMRCEVPCGGGGAAPVSALVSDDPTSVTVPDLA